MGSPPWTRAHDESIGIGPWEAYPPLGEYDEPKGDPSPQRIHLDTKGEGIFHIGFEVPAAGAAGSQAQRDRDRAARAAEEPDGLHLSRHRRQGRRRLAGADDATAPAV